MADLKKISDNMNKYTEEVLAKLDKEIAELKQTSIAVKFDKHIAKKLSRN